MFSIELCHLLFSLLSYHNLKIYECQIFLVDDLDDY